MLWTAFILGLFGGMHCAGMCGPIALAIPRKEGILPNVFHKGLYNSGRIITYTVMGGVTGLIGQSFDLAGWQQGLSISLGIFLILVIVITGFRNLDVPLIGPVIGFTHALKKYFSHFLKKRSWGAAIAMGLINGLLPCGLVYIALAASIGTGGLESGILYMLVFGLGTFPIMFFISITGNMIGPVLRRKIYKLVPVFVITLGLLFILRGMNLGIPLISPEIGSTESPTHFEMCEP